MAKSDDEKAATGGAKERQEGAATRRPGVWAFPRTMAHGEPGPGRLPEHEASVIVKRVLEKAGGTLTCQVCGTHEWHLSDLVGRLDAVSEPDRGYPVVVLVCKNCGQMLLFNALALGLKYVSAQKTLHVDPGSGGTDG